MSLNEGRFFLEQKGGKERLLFKGPLEDRRSERFSRFSIFEWGARKEKGRERDPVEPSR
jgi:hypothetical protein